MCGGKSTTQQTTTIPPEVMAKYNAVYARGEEAANQPFQKYAGEFVAPLTATQQAGISNINQASGMAQGQMNEAQNILGSAYKTSQPYMQQALGTAASAYGQGQNQLGQAQGYLTNAAAQGQIYGGQAYTPIAGALSAASPYMQSATQLTGGGLSAAAPMMGAAEGFLGGATQAVNPQEFGQAQINKYMSPYMKNVVEAQQALQQQESAAQRSALSSQAIGAGAFGGDRAGIAQANLARQQSLANQATLSNLLQQGYGQAAGMFQQQQGINLAAQQANRAAQQFGSQQAGNLAQQRFAQQMGVGKQLAELGQQQFGQNIAAGQALAGLGQQMYTQGLGAAQAQQGLGQATYGMGAQQGAFEQGIGKDIYAMGAQQATTKAGLAAQQQGAALQGAQAQLAAGTLEQQTKQAEDTALYNQFLQERGYPFQTAQFLGNLALGTGALSGSTTTTTQPNSFFSDRRLKKDVKEIGSTHDGLPIYSFKYKGGDEQPRIGVMADEAREKHPDAVHRVGGIDAVDYEKIANRASEGGGVMPSRAGQGFAEGGHVGDQDLATIIAMQRQFLGPHAEGGLYGQSTQNLPGGKGIVPQASLPVARLQRHSAPQQQPSAARQVMSELGQANQLGETLLGDKGLGAKARQVYNYATGSSSTTRSQPTRQASSVSSNSSAATSQGGNARQRGVVENFAKPQQTTELAPDAGGVIPRTNVAMSNPITPRDEDVISPSDMFGSSIPAARGGVIPHKAAGGGSGFLREGVLPYQTEEKYGPEAINEAESGEKYDLLKPDAPPPKQKSGFENVLDAAKLATKVVGMFMAKDGGAINGSRYENGGGVRPAFADGSDVEEQSPIVKYRDYMVQKGLEPHVASGIAANIDWESSGKPQIWGDNDNSFGLFQKNIRGELPAFRQWAQENKRDMHDPYSQIDHVIDRLQGPYAKVYQQMRDSNDPAQAAYQFAVGYERPRPETANYEGRMRTAAQLERGEYAGKGIAPSDGRKRSVAGAEYVRGQGQKGTTYVDGQPVEEPSSGLMPTNFRTGKPFSGIGDFLTDRQFIVPLLSGVGAMASSPSRYFGGALLQGIGAAAQSYGGMEKTQQEISESKARELKDLASIPNSAMVTGPDGRLVGFRVYKNGKLDVVSVSEFYDALNRGQPYQIAPASRGEMETGTATAGPSPSGGMGAEGGAGAKPSFEEPKAPTPPQPGQYRGVDPETNKLIGQRSRDVIQSNIKDLATNPANSPFASQQKAANVAQSGLQMRNQYGSALADMKFSNTGKFADEVKLPILRYFADTLAGLGVPKDAIPVDFEQLGQKQIVDKIRTSVAFTKDQEAQQKSFQSVLSQLEALPGVANNRDAAAGLIADLYVTPQRDIELNKYYNDAKNIAVRQYKLPFDMANYIGDGLADRFADQYNQQFSKDKKAIAQMYNERINVPDKDGNVKNYNVLSYLAKTGADVPPEVKAAIEKRYGAGITRYFSGK